MSELDTLAHELRMIAGNDGDWAAGPISASVLREAADAIMSMRDRLQAVNDGCEYCNNGKEGFDGQKAMMSNHGWQTIRHCPNCGKRLVDE